MPACAAAISAGDNKNRSSCSLFSRSARLDLINLIGPVPLGGPFFHETDPLASLVRRFRAPQKIARVSFLSLILLPFNRIGFGGCSENCEYFRDYYYPGVRQI
jgi:hypothetical protein